MSSRQSVSLNIKNPEVYKAATQLADLQGTTITAAVLNALNDALRRHDQIRRSDSEVRRMEHVARRVAALPLLDSRTPDEILGYGPEGFLDGD